MPAPTTRRLTVFYSWQSDRELSCCKNFTRIAAEDAAARLSETLGIEVAIESDTENVPGTPPISDTILRKIEECDLFLGDMTFVAETNVGKKIPNPNVMGEYGYALKCKGTEHILLVMNTAFGGPEDLPFDLRHLRHPAQYSLSEDAPDGERRNTRARFSAKLEANLQVAIDKLLDKPSTQAADLSWDAAETAILSAAVLPPPVPVSFPKLVVRVVPLAALPGVRLPPAAVKAARPHFIPPINSHVFEGADETVWWSHGSKRRVADHPNPETDWLFLFSRPGIFQVSTNIGHRIDDDPTIVVDGHNIEQSLVDVVDRCALVAKSVGLDGPALVSASIEGIEDVEISRPSPGSGGRRIRRPSAFLGKAKLASLSTSTAGQLHELMESIWFIGGWDDGSPYIVDGQWTP